MIPLIISGTYAEAVVYANEIEDTAIEQIKIVVNTAAFSGLKIRIMPDVHAGAGCVIGFTSNITDKVISNLVGVDISCGMLVVKLGTAPIDYPALDDFIHNNIPSGFAVNGKPYSNIGESIPGKLAAVCSRIETDYDRALLSIGTLGGGNHFIEIEVDEQGCKYLVIHSGSRNFGLKVANYHQKIAETRCAEDGIDVPKELSYLTGNAMDLYLSDMNFTHDYASMNRTAMATQIADYLGATLEYSFQVIHNYISKDRILRKGAISSREGEKVLIPLNMRDGSILGIGKGNPDWNYSAPHGAGRIMGRKQAKRELSLAVFKEVMEGIYSSCIRQSTIDESPMAYKSFGSEVDIREMLSDTVEVTAFLKPEYNFKATGEEQHAFP